jgi:hypothetical protein
VYVERYLQLLNNVLGPCVDKMSFAVRRLVDFRQDGTPLLFAVEVRNWLDEVIRGRWIGRRGQIEWPPRFPDLTPLDSFLWGHLKSLVFHTHPHAINDFKANISAVCRDSTPQNLERVPCNVQFCKNLCNKRRGTNLNIYFPNALSYEIELMGHPVCEITRCSIR